jgi:hypothetical protein
MDELGKCLPSIKAVYECYDELGYDKDKILQKFKDHHWVQSLKAGSAEITYKSVGQELADQDSSQGSFTNEDPDWHSLADSLDAGLLANQALSNPPKYSDSALKAVEAWTGPPPASQFHRYIFENDLSLSWFIAI